MAGMLAWIMSLSPSIGSCPWQGRQREFVCDPRNTDAAQLGLYPTRPFTNRGPGESKHRHTPAKVFRWHEACEILAKAILRSTEALQSEVEAWG